jgi:adenylate kinase
VAGWVIGGHALFQVVYLTGAPAAVKSTTAKLLAARVSAVEVFEYGERLRAYVAERSGANLVPADLRRESARRITPAGVKAVDKILLDFVVDVRKRSHVIIDSHPVTKEDFGFRITPFALDQFAKLRPTQVWMLYASPETTMERIALDAQGRPTITAAEAAMHTHLQASVATTYGARLGAAIHFFDTSMATPAEIAELLAAKLSRS